MTAPLLAVSILYFTRSDLNRLTASRKNTAQTQWLGIKMRFNPERVSQQSLGSPQRGAPQVVMNSGLNPNEVSHSRLRMPAAIVEPHSATLLRILRCRIIGKSEFELAIQSRRDGGSLPSARADGYGGVWFQSPGRDDSEWCGILLSSLRDLGFTTDRHPVTRVTGIGLSSLPGLNRNRSEARVHRSTATLGFVV